MRRAIWLGLLVACQKTAPQATPDPAASKPTVADTRSPPVKGVLLRTCAPWDGPALRIVVSEQASCATLKPNPRTDITVYRDLPKEDAQVSHRWKFGTNVDEGHANQLGGAEPEALIGWVELDYPLRETVKGRMHLQGKALRAAELELRHCPTEPMCG